MEADGGYQEENNDNDAASANVFDQILQQDKKRRAKAKGAGA